MTQTHPINLPEELVNQWRSTPEYTDLSEKLFLVTLTTKKFQDIATKAAQWGADQELEACVKAIKQILGIEHVVTDDDVMCELRAIRRPKPPSLKERLSKAIIDGDEREALKLLEGLDD